MKRQLLLIAITTLLSTAAVAQPKCYWVFLTDKNNTEFDPYTYFDSKAIERYEKCGASLYDISNYPLNRNYTDEISSLSEEVVGESRWLNAMGIMASDENIEIIRKLSFVKNVEEISSDYILASNETYNADIEEELEILADKGILTDQVIRLGGQHFIDKGIDGKGLRIAVFDGGFPYVDKHVAFQHLRDNNQIISTYNFPNHREDVYGWNSHGTMVLSCIAGIKDGKKLGLATGAEFLLARTEVNAEPFKEEVWWEQAVEWADKNGADLINSSLGYGKERHYTKDMDGTSYVAKAANMAARKGILVCCSAGNEGDVKWATIVTPSDADSVLCVGGIISSLKEYRHISFSSYGPSADGRIKPNVCSFGHAKVASPNGRFTEADGTSFSSPLTTGFCACAWQTRPNLTAMEMKTEVEKSGDLYPYYDYAFGYGVPQAAYFTGDYIQPQRTFNLIDNNESITIHFLNDEGPNEVFMNVEGENGILLGYYQLITEDYSDISYSKKELGNGKKINVSYNGFYDSCPISNNSTENVKLSRKDNAIYALRNDNTFPPKSDSNKHITFFFRYGYNLPNATWDGYSRNIAFGERNYVGGKRYQFAYAFAFDFYKYTSKSLTNAKTQINTSNFELELLNHFIIVPKGFYLDLGAYGSVTLSRKEKFIMSPPDGDDPAIPYKGDVIVTYKRFKDINWYQYGVIARASYDFGELLTLSVFGTYRLSKIIKNQSILLNTNVDPSPWSIGIEFEFGL